MPITQEIMIGQHQNILIKQETARIVLLAFRVAPWPAGGGGEDWVYVSKETAGKPAASMQEGMFM